MENELSISTERAEFKATFHQGAGHHPWKSVRFVTGKISFRQVLPSVQCVPYGKNYALN